MTLSPSAAGTMNRPPLMNVPAGAVVIDWTWQMAQPIELNKLRPVWASAVAARYSSRGGAVVALMNRATVSTPAPSSSGSATVSYMATETPLDVFSTGSSGEVMPISLRYSSAENDSRLAC